MQNTVTAAGYGFRILYNLQYFVFPIPEVLQATTPTEYVSERKNYNFASKTDCNGTINPLLVSNLYLHFRHTL